MANEWRITMIALLALLSSGAGRYGGERLTFETVECVGETERFEGFEVATDRWTEFTDSNGTGTGPDCSGMCCRRTDGTRSFVTTTDPGRRRQSPGLPGG